ncbi:proepiregulin [Camelus ferus]|uniref:Proepiregulin n=2 Tax=Camelus TaxID=9836 RepID=A0A8B8RY60_CAMFR|nr:proepiregulin [Camelus ferus]
MRSFEALSKPNESESLGKATKNTTHYPAGDPTEQTNLSGPCSPPPPAGAREEDGKLVLGPEAPPQTYKGRGAGPSTSLAWQAGCRTDVAVEWPLRLCSTRPQARAQPASRRRSPQETMMEPVRACQVPALLLCLGFHLLQAVLSTTVIPSCIPGESKDNCTALVQTEDNPRVAQVSITKCSSDMNGYCLHGQCIYLVDMSENYCRCEVGYTGVRCEHFFLTVQQPLSKEYVALSVILVILFLVLVAGSIYYFCRCYRNRKGKEPKKEYERVTSGDPTLPQV